MHDGLVRRPVPRLVPSARALLLVAAVAVLAGCATPETPSAYDKILDLPGTPRSAVSADFDRDGDTDVLLGYDGDEHAGLTLLADDGYGRWRRDDLDVSAGSARHMAVTDLDGDGHRDVVAGGDGPLLRLLRNDGHGRFTAGTYNLIWALEVTAIAGGTAPDGTRLVAVAYDVPTSPTDRAPLVIMFEATGGGLTLADPNGAIQQPAATRSLLLDDVDDDGRTDLLAGTVDGRVLLYRGTGDAGVLSTTPVALQDAGRGTPVLALAAGDVATPPSTELGPTGDWDADGRHDILAAFEDGEWIYGWRNTGSGTFSAPLHLGGLGESPPGQSFRPVRALMIDPEGSGLWGGVTGSWVYFGNADVIGRAYAPGAEKGICTAYHQITLMPKGEEPFPGVISVCAAPTRMAMIAVPFRSRLGLPASVDFDPRPVDAEPQSRTVKISVPDRAALTSQGVVDVEDVRVEGPDAGEFEADATLGTCTGLPIAAPCNVTVTFRPRTPGTKRARLVVDTTAYRAPGMPPHVVELTGTATPAAAAPAPSAPPDTPAGAAGPGPDRPATQPQPQPQPEPAPDGRPRAGDDTGRGAAPTRAPARARLALHAPARVLLAGRRPRAIRLVVRNTGMRAATGAVLRVRLPRGVQRLVTGRGGRARVRSGTVAVRIGRLPARRARTITIRVRLTRAGAARLAVRLTARDAAGADATVVLQRR
jgi:hypothetical protein